MTTPGRRFPGGRARWLLGAGLVVVVGAAGFLALGYHPAIAPLDPGAARTFPADQAARGAELAAIGDCAVCHTAPGGARLAGGRGVPTPFGTVYAANITPDQDTGIGRWSEEAFRRAMRDGIARDGSHLYPVLPYPHFTRASDADIGALYAYLMTRQPVPARPPANQLPFPLDQRAVLAGWNLLFLRQERWQPDPSHDAAWNRGAYLVEAVGHCGACHSPHNALGAEQGGQPLAGGEAEGWWAPPLDQGSPARRPWTQAQLAAYLRTGYASEHGAAAGPMTEVTEQLAAVPDADVAAIATYIASFMPAGPAPAPLAARDGTETGRALFGGACASCHAEDAPMTSGGAPSLALNTGVNAPTPRGVIQVILFGIPWREGKPAPYMPAFGPALTDAQVGELANYLRTRYTGKPAWTGVPDEVAKARKAGGAT